MSFIIEYRPKSIMAIFREWSDSNKQQDEESRDHVQNIKSHLATCLPAENHVTLT